GPSAMVGNRFTDFAGRPHNDLLLALCHKMGVESESFGDTSVTTGPLLF
ncbi:MAG: hypothetical protein JNK04_07815, partial [Myxococcales bacterium]|nr:hypothetical protein [Myxococcales bacterium]